MNIYNLIAGILSITWGQSKPPSVQNLTETSSATAAKSRNTIIKASTPVPTESETILSQIVTSLNSTHKFINKFIEHLFQDLKEEVNAEAQPVVEIISHEVNHVKTELKPFFELLEKLKNVKLFDSEQIKKVAVTGAILGASLGSIFEGITEETLGEVSLYPYVQSIGIDKETLLNLTEAKKGELIKAISNSDYSTAVILFIESLPAKVVQYFSDKPAEYGGFIMGALAGITFAHRFRKEQTNTPLQEEVIDGEFTNPQASKIKPNKIKLTSPILESINDGLSIMIKALPKSTKFRRKLIEFRSNLANYNDKPLLAKEEVSELIKSYLGQGFMREENLDAVFGKYFSFMRNLRGYISYNSLEFKEFNQSSIRLDKLRQILDIALCVNVSYGEENAKFKSLREHCYGMFDQWQKGEGQCSFVDFAGSFKKLALTEFGTNEFNEYQGRSRSEVAKEVLANFLMNANNPEILKRQLERFFDSTKPLNNVLKDFDKFVAHLRETHSPDFVNC